MHQIKRIIPIFMATLFVLFITAGNITAKGYPPKHYNAKLKVEKIIVANFELQPAPDTSPQAIIANTFKAVNSSAVTKDAGSTKFKAVTGLAADSSPGAVIQDKINIGVNTVATNQMTDNMNKLPEVVQLK